MNNWQLDQAVTGVKYNDKDPAKGAVITIANLQQMAMPLTLEMVLADGTKQRIQLPVETWLQGAVQTINVATTQKIKQVTLDPDHVLPDGNRANNVWK